MTNCIPRNKTRVTLRGLQILFILLMFIYLSGCVAAVAIYYLQTPQSLTVAAEMDAKAEDVYRGFRSYSQSIPGTIEIIVDDETEFRYEHKRIMPETGEEVWFAFDVTAIGKNKSHFLGSATIGARSGDEVREYVLDGIQHFCKENRLECKIVE